MNFKIWLLGGLSVVIFGVIAFYSIMPPQEFYTEEELLTYIDKSRAEFQPEIIEDIIYIDGKHIFVPYTNTEQLPGVMLFKWQKGEWQAIGGSINMPKHFWQLDTTDPSKSYVIWHHRFDEVVDLQINIERHSGLSYSNEQAFYSPQIRMKHEIKDAENYGVYKVSEEWAEVMRLQEEPSILQTLLGYQASYFVNLSAKFLNDNQEEVYNEESGSGFGSGIHNMFHQIL